MRSTCGVTCPASMRDLMRSRLTTLLLRGNHRQSLADEGREQRSPQRPAEAAGDPAAALLAAQEDSSPVRGERAAQSGQRRVARDVQDQVVTTAGGGEVLAGAVDDV